MPARVIAKTALGRPWILRTKEETYDWNRLDRSVGFVSDRRTPDVEPQPFLGLFSQQRTGFDTGRRRGFAAAWPDLVERY